MTRLADAEPWSALVRTDPVTEPFALTDRDVASPVAVIIGAVGGSGASTLASGLALARAAEGDAAVLVEFALDRADLAGAWGLPARRTLDDLVPVQAELDARHLDMVAHRHSSGVAILLGPGRPGAERDWETAATGDLLACTRGIGASIVDAGAHLGAHVQTAIGLATAVILVTPPTILGARRVRDLVPGLVHWADGDRIVLVANRGVGRDHLSSRAFVRACGMPVSAELPRSDREADEIGAGRWPRSRRARLTGAIRGLNGAVI